MCSATKTQDLLGQAKDKLMSALRVAESELKAADLKKLEKLTADAEALQARLADRY